jgi:two-component system, OmpR family, response regulator MprA
MTAKRGLIETSKGQNVLVVDDDRRVRELLEIALTAHGYGVLTAADGDEAIRRALGQRPDLIVLDVRLPKKSGLEVCDALRGDTEDPTVPIILVSAAVETDARLQAFARGADDYLSKPFSPKELIARIKRHLARHADARAAQRRALDLERQLSHAQEEARRAEALSQREQALRELQSTSGRDFLRTIDLDVLADRVLASIQRRLNVGAAALLIADGPGRPLRTRAVRGAGLDRIADLELRPGGEVARVLAGLDRPMLRADLERIPELTTELAPFMSAGFTLFVPLRGASSLEALVVTSERHDGMSPTRAELDVLGGLCESAAIALENGARFRAQLDGLLDLLAERAHQESGLGSIFDEASRLAERTARASLVPARESGLVRRAVSIGLWGSTAEGRHALARLRAIDPTGRVADLERLLDSHAAPPCPPTDETIGRARIQRLLRIGWSYAEARATGARPEQAVGTAVERTGEPLDPVLHRAMAIALDETVRQAD